METITIKRDFGLDGKYEVKSLAEVSDGYHTIEELYEHRNLLFLALCSIDPKRCWWREDPETPGWFLLYMETGQIAGQLSYHLPDKYKFFVENIEHRPNGEWDNSMSVLDRLNWLIKRVMPKKNKFPKELIREEIWK